MPEREAVNRPFYTIEDMSSDEEKLRWINEIYEWHRMDGEECQRIRHQTDLSALYLDLCPVDNRILTVTSQGGINIAYDRREYGYLIDPVIHYAVENWTSRMTARKPSFAALARDVKDTLKLEKAKILQAVTNAYFRRDWVLETRTDHTRQAFMKGESYVEVFWDERSGPLIPEIQAKLDADGLSSLDEIGQDSPHMTQGDVRSRVLDARNVITDRADSYELTEWAIIKDAIPTEKVKFMYPDQADDILSSDHPSVFLDGRLSGYQGTDRTLVFTFYHRPCLEIPKGKIIKATKEVILEENDFPSLQWVKSRYFPILQLTDHSPIGSNRGYASTVMDNMYPGQMHLQSLWKQALMNAAYHSPKLFVQAGSLDLNQLNTPNRSVVSWKKGYEKPFQNYQEYISQGHLLLMDKLRSNLLKNANIQPISHGDSMPNMESRQLFDAVKEQENAQSVPKDVKETRFLKEWAKGVMMLMADKMAENETRVMTYFGKLNRHEKVTFSGKDLQIEADIFVDTASAFSGTIASKMQTIMQIDQMLPGFYTPAEKVENLELGSPEKVLDDATASQESARLDIERIMSGKDVRPPDRTKNLVAYYDILRKEISRPEIQELLPESHDPNSDSIGNRILTQVSAVELELMSILDQSGPMDPTTGATVGTRGDMPVFMPQLGIEQPLPLRNYLYGKYPGFPAVYSPDTKKLPNPMEVQQEAIAQLPTDNNLEESGNPPGNPKI